MNPQLKASSSLDRAQPHAMGSSNLIASRWKHEKEAKTLKLIEDKDWNIASTVPESETTFFADGHPAMSIISAIGMKGVGKSSLLNKIAKRQVFKTHQSSPASSRPNLRHVTRGIDIFATHQRMLLDCQPVLSPSVLMDFVSGDSGCQFAKSSQITDPYTSCRMISLQLATFLIAVSDYVIIMSDWLIDQDLLRLISMAIMMIGASNLRAKFVIFSRHMVAKDRLKQLVDGVLGIDRVEKYFDNEQELIDHVSPYPSEKCDIYWKEPTTFSGNNWLSSCQRLWNTTIKNSPMFTELASQYNSVSTLTRPI